MSSPNSSTPKGASSQDLKKKSDTPHNLNTKPTKTFLSCRMRKPYVILLACTIVIGAIFAAFLVLNTNKSTDSTPSSQSTTPEFTTLDRTPFADFELELADFTPAVPDYSLGTDMENVANIDRFDFSSPILDQLSESYFAVVEPEILYPESRTYDEFFSIFNGNVGPDIPSFITTDSILHIYHLLFDDALKTLEQSTFYEEVLIASDYMYEASQSHYDYFLENDNTEYADSAKRNVAYFAVGLKLLGEDIVVPDYAADLVSYELDNIDSHNGTACSMLMDLTLGTPPDCYEEDYTQYVPRGHYTRTERLGNYFKAMMWYGRMTFLQKDDSATKSALLQVLALNNDSEALTSWSNAFDAISFIVGSSDDLVYYDYRQVAEEQFSEFDSLDDLSDDRAYNDFTTEIKDLRAPAVNSMIVYDFEFDDDSFEEETKGYRFMGQRYTLDADIFQMLIFPKVQYDEDNNKRNIPKSIDILAGMGSEKATSILEDEGDYLFENFEENLKSVQTRIAEYEESTWTQNLYFGWLYMLKPLINPVTSGYPDFMESNLWVNKDMNTYLGSWTELKHDTILYSKQTYGGAGAGGYLYLELDDRGYVEPRPDVYARLEALTEMTLEGLENRDLLEGVDYEFTEGSGPDCSTDPEQNPCSRTYSFSSEELIENLENLASTAATLKTISVKELNDQPLTDEEYDFIREYGDFLFESWRFTLHNNDWGTESLDEYPVMIVSDVATDPEAGNVLEEGLGRVMWIYAIIPVSGGEYPDYYRIARGAVWSHYDFHQPMSDRLTDKAWREQVREGDLPELSDWKKEYIFENTSISVADKPITFARDIEEGTRTLEEARQSCESMSGIFEECGNVCPEYDRDCDTACEPICRFY